MPWMIQDGKMGDRRNIALSEEEIAEIAEIVAKAQAEYDAEAYEFMRERWPLMVREIKRLRKALAVFAKRENWLGDYSYTWLGDDEPWKFASKALEGVSHDQHDA